MTPTPAASEQKQINAPMTEGERCAAKLKRWQESEEGQRCAAGQASGEYLQNRLYYAYFAGWSDAKLDSKLHT